jgi:hypothetical protein
MSCTTYTRGKIRIATYDGSLMNPYVAMVRAFSLGNPGIHTELWVDTYRVSTFHLNKCVDIKYLDEHINSSDWHLVDVPITDHVQAVQFLKDAMQSPADYSISLTEISMPKMLLDSIDHDLDCCHPEQWDKLFCSQFALLFLRRCAIAGILDIPKSKQKLLWSVNSKGCLPGRLQLITDQLFSTSRQ